MKPILILVACSVVIPVSYSKYLGKGDKSVPLSSTLPPADDDLLAGPKEIAFYQSATCSEYESIYRIPLTGDCQAIPSWILDDEWDLGVRLSTKFLVKFYSDADCDQWIEDDYATTRNAKPACQHLGGLGLSTRYFKLI